MKPQLMPGVLLDEKSSQFLDVKKYYFSESESPQYWKSTTFLIKCVWLSLYFCLSLIITIHNKLTMGVFPFPYLLTGLHALCNIVGIATMWLNGSYKPTLIDANDTIAVALFSLLYGINIAVSNVSLNYVTVPVHQVIRALSPMMVVALSLIFCRKRYGMNIYTSLAVISFGVGLATFGDYNFNLYGVCLTLLGAFLASAKTLTTTSILKTSAKLEPIDLLFYLSPMAVIQMLLVAVSNGELFQVYHDCVSAPKTNYLLCTNLAVNGSIAFALNIASFTANKRTGAVAISVAANVKQVMTIVLAVIMFSLRISFLNSLGIAVTLAGGMWYASIEYTTKRTTVDFQSPHSSPKLDMESGFPREDK